MTGLPRDIDDSRLFVVILTVVARGRRESFLAHSLIKDGYGEALRLASYTRAFEWSSTIAAVETLLVWPTRTLG